METKNIMAAKKGYGIVVRFTDKQQKNYAKRLAENKNQSFNGWILSYINEQIALDIEKQKAIKGA